METGASSFGAYVPDLPGCMAVGETRDEVTKLIREAIAFPIEGLLQDGLTVPLPHPAALGLCRVTICGTPP
ncbi:hypothetical protein DIC66_07230 [Rhodoferax lacus]|uniref:HicB-like antitoxin of toxin-antitoxin system domain-containing protein n=1 Tax=Rhodoferax lacus TaxID=2184758 RepID=A0A3E1REC9_9BURK|nr:type II toxin-antitoxin system HicB family antitoxin [Rhodoferax lacus]RFO97643.1 hypothetical protein DIC66_07230 [Rhodoferax lacus]